jgi:hypothetical protein
MQRHERADRGPCAWSDRCNHAPAALSNRIGKQPMSVPGLPMAKVTRLDPWRTICVWGLTMSELRHDRIPQGHSFGRFGVPDRQLANRGLHHD